MNSDSFKGESMVSKSSKHLNSYIHVVVNLLKQYDRALSFEEVLEKVNIDLYNNYALLQSIKKNPRIVVTHGTLMFKPLYSIRSVDDLRAVIKALNNEEGVEMSKLSDSSVNITPFIDELRKNNEIIILCDLDKSEIVFGNDMQEKTADSRIKCLWNQVRVPTYHDLIRELNTAGLQAEKVENVKKRVVVKEKKGRRGRRHVKITNTHVKGLDLSGVQDER